MKLRITLVIAAIFAFTLGAAARTIRVLAIGNSFSEDAVEQYLYELGQDAGVDFVIGNLYIGGCPLQRHWNNVENDAPTYRYRKIKGNAAYVQTDNVKISTAVADEEWDYISLQQASGVSGVEKSYEPWLTNLVQYLHRAAPKSKIIWHQTWAYAKNSDHGEFPNYGRDQQKMYSMICSAARSAVKRHKLNRVVPSGTAIQNARQTYIGDNMNRDGFHLNFVHGRYTAACTWFEALTGRNVTGCTYAPAGMDSRMAATCRQAAHNAVKHPWKTAKNNN
jgi:beta-glucosidase